MGDSMVIGKNVGNIAGGGRTVVDANSKKSGDFTERVTVGGKDYYLTPAGKSDYDAMVGAQSWTGQEIKAESNTNDFMAFIYSKLGIKTLDSEKIDRGNT